MKAFYIYISPLLWVLSLSACQQSVHTVYEPSADNLLSAISKADRSVIQVEKIKCIRYNPFEKEEGYHSVQFDEYRCAVKIVHYNTEFNQEFSEQKEISVVLSSAVTGEWQLL